MSFRSAFNISRRLSGFSLITFAMACATVILFGPSGFCWIASVIALANVGSLEVTEVGKGVESKTCRYIDFKNKYEDQIIPYLVLN